MTGSFGFIGFPRNIRILALIQGRPNSLIHRFLLFVETVSGRALLSRSTAAVLPFTTSDRFLLFAKPFLRARHTFPKHSYKVAICRQRPIPLIHRKTVTACSTIPSTRTGTGSRTSFNRAPGAVSDSGYRVPPGRRSSGEFPLANAVNAV